MEKFLFRVSAVRAKTRQRVNCRVLSRRAYYRFMVHKTLLLLLPGVLAFGQTNRNLPRPSGPGAATQLLNLLKQEVKPDQAMKDIRTIWEVDRYFTFPKFEETAKNVAAMMKRAGLEDVEIGNPPADGVSQGGWWTMPLAWDVKTGTLEILDSSVPIKSRVLADYQKVPTSIGMWSGPTPKGGVETEIVLVNGSLEGLDLKGKLVLGWRGGKTALAKAGALGLISDVTENPELVDERGWVNSFG